MSDPVKMELMYREPGSKDHRNITHVLDDVIVKLKEIENRLTELEERTSWQ